MNDLLGSDLPSDGFDTLGGFIYNHVGHVPEGGQTITVPNFEIIILAVDGQRIQQVQMKRIAAEDNGNGEPDETSDSES